MVQSPKNKLILKKGDNSKTSPEKVRKERRSSWTVNLRSTMARHLMAVCVVCLLCADHLPCKQHFSDDGTEKLVPGPRGTLRNVRSLLDQQQYEPVVAAYDAVHRIVRRHAHHHHEEEDHEEEDVHTEGVSEAPTEFDRLIKGKMEQAMRKIFTEYGDPASMTMDVQGFERMVRQLGMIRLVQSGVAAPIDGSGSDATETTPQQVDSLKVSSVPVCELIHSKRK